MLPQPLNIPETTEYPYSSLQPTSSDKYIYDMLDANKDGHETENAKESGECTRYERVEKDKGQYNTYWKLDVVEAGYEIPDDGDVLVNHRTVYVDIEG